MSTRTLLQKTLVLLSLVTLYGAAGAAAEMDLETAGTRFFEQADRVGTQEGEPPAAPVYRGEKLLGFVFETVDVAPIPAYSGKPINLMVGIDVDGRITGAELLEHHEPILLVGIPEARLGDFARAFAGKSYTRRIHVGGGGSGQHIDGISGATVTVQVVAETIMRAGRNVARSRGLIEGAGRQTRRRTRAVRQHYFEPADWQALTGNGAIRRMRVSRGDVDDAFRGTAAEGIDTAPQEARDDTFIDLYYTYLNVPAIGRNLLGQEQFQWLRGELDPGEHAIAVFGRGEYSFKGSGYVRGGIFDRVQLQQGERTINFRDLDHRRLADLHIAGAPAFDEMSLFTIREDARFSPDKPWRLDLLVRRATGPLDSVFTTFTGSYRLPDSYLQAPAAPAAKNNGGRTAAAADAGAADGAPIWKSIWYQARFKIAVLGLGLGVLTLILFFQDQLVKRARLVPYVRTGFLLYTLFFIGWYSLAQLSVVNVFTFAQSVFGDFRWQTFLVDPMMFILWSFVAVTLLLWGRGVFCGWLCPFGALQELVNKLARRLKVPQLELPFAVHERLWALKYVILLALFGVSLQSLGMAERYAEVEPFKTAITLRFQREWGYLLYAGGLVLVSAFNRKFYCRYMCPLGAALVIPGRFKIFDWLKRHHRDCGKPCQICANECEVKAIHPDGRINTNECHYCLDCQVTYWDDRKCPPMIKERKRLERMLKMAHANDQKAEAKEQAPA